MPYQVIASCVFLISLIMAYSHALALKTPVPIRAGTEKFSSRVLATDLDFPWEILWGPDGHLWITEQLGKRVTRVNPADGSKITAITIEEVRQEGGLLGMALHPELLNGTGNDYVYVAYTYDAAPGEKLDHRAKIRRYTYDRVTQKLGAPVDIITGLPAHNDHNAGRLVYGPDHKLYYSIGDHGSNQFLNACNVIVAQDTPSNSEVGIKDYSTYQGKILRLNLDGTVPSDNPEINGVRSHVYTYGHRNPQGLAFGPDGILYSAEHGPKTDDEVNIIQAGKNYGWPQVAGYKDDKAYVYANWSASTTPCQELRYNAINIPASVPKQKESAWSHPDFVAPIATFFTVEDGYDFSDPNCQGRVIYCWPTIAPSSVEIYVSDGGGISGWSRSLLMTSLKHGSLYRVQLANDGLSVESELIVYFPTENRYRDVALSPDGRTIYIATDGQGSKATRSDGAKATLKNPGSILEFKYGG
jgi:PQQ-dependent dehydrogenase (s-GDH family)